MIMIKYESEYDKENNKNNKLNNNWLNKNLKNDIIYHRINTSRKKERIIKE